MVKDEFRTFAKILVKQPVGFSGSQVYVID